MSTDVVPRTSPQRAEYDYPPLSVPLPLLEGMHFLLAIEVFLLLFRLFTYGGGNCKKKILQIRSLAGGGGTANTNQISTTDLLSGTSVRVLQSRYTIAVIYRLMFFTYRKVSRYNPPNAIAIFCWKHAATIAAQTTVSFLSRCRGIAAILVQIAV